MTTHPAGSTLPGLPRHRRLADERLHQAYAHCPDDDALLVPTGDAFSEGESPSSSADWFIAFRCPRHPEEVIRLVQPALLPLLDEVLDGVDVAALAVVGPGLR